MTFSRALAASGSSTGSLAPAYRTPRFPQATVICTEFQAGHAFTATGGTFNANDTTDHVRGTQAAKLTTPGDNTTYYVTGTVTSFDSTGKLLRLVAKIDDITTLSNLQVDVCTDTTWANGWTWTAQGGAGGSNYFTSGDWAMISLGFADATQLGSGPRAGLAAIRIRIKDTGTPVNVHLQALELIPDGTATFPNGVVVLTADDGYQSFLDLGKAKLDQYGYPVTAFVIADRLGRSGRATMQELQDLQNTSGWELASHAYADAIHSATFTGITAAQLDADARAMKTFALQNGFRCADLVAYPKGQYGKTTDGVSTTSILQKYYSMACSTVGKTRETYPPADYWRIRRISGISSYTGGYAPSAITQTGGDLDKIKANGGCLILNFHQLVTTAPTDTSMCLQSDFQAIVDAINSKGIPVIPMGELMRYALTTSSGGASIDSASIPKKLGPVGSPGAASLASAADHVHPRAFFGPEDHSYLTWWADPAALASSQAPASGAGVLQLVRLHLPVAATVSNVVLFVASAGATLTAGQNFAGLYNASGSLLSATADQSTAWQSTGTKITALTTPQQCAAGDYYVAFYANGTTLPSFLRGAGNVAGNTNLTAAASRFATAATGLTTAMPASAGTLSGSSAAFWAALS